jgi:hypothetical protein
MAEHALLPQAKMLYRWPCSTIATTIILGVIGLALIFQSNRWGRTPSYANLLAIFSADTWGCVYLAISVGMGLCLMMRHQRIFCVLAHTAAFVLLLGWEFGFIVRYLTDSATTIANVVSWATYIGIVVWSALLIDRHDAA